MTSVLLGSFFHSFFHSFRLDVLAGREMYLCMLFSYGIVSFQPRQEQEHKEEMKATYGLLRKLPCVLLGFYPKKRVLGLGYTSSRFFMVKSEYLICYDKATSKKLQSTTVQQLNDYATLANREEIKRVIKLSECKIKKVRLHSYHYKMELYIQPLEGRKLRMAFKNIEECEMWYAILIGSRCVIHLEDFEVLGELGQGAFGKVELVRYIQDGKCYAMKTVELKGEGNRLLSQFVEERTVMQKLQSCPFIVQLRMAFREANDLYYVMEYCEKGDLLNYIRSKTRLTEDELRPFAASLVLAVGSMHSLCVLHRDIKPENVLLTEAGVAKLADFGLSKTLSSMRSRAFSFCGTDLYRPPEMSENAAGYNRALDWWQVGCVIYEMAVGVPPFDGSKEERRRKVLKEEPKYPEFLSTELVVLLRGLLRKCPWERLGAGDGDYLEVRNMPFFARVNWEKLEALAREEGSETPMATPSPMRPETKVKRKQSNDRLIEAELMGFEYNQRIMLELCRSIQAYSDSGAFYFSGAY